MARSALAAHISALEAELGFPLFDRAAGAELTMEGSIFLAHIEPMLRGLETVVMQCAERASSKPADNDDAVRVSYAGADASMLAIIRQLSPAPVVFLPYNPNKPLLDNIEESDPDIVVVFFFDVNDSERFRSELASLGFVSQPAGFHPCSLIIGAAHSLAQKSASLASQDLEGCRVLLSAQPEFDYLQETAEAMLRHAPNLSFGLLPDWSDEGLMNLDLRDDLLLSMSPRTIKLFAGDPRIRIIRELDGMPFGFEQIAITRQRPRNKNVTTFYRAFGGAIADGTWAKALSKQA